VSSMGRLAKVEPLGADRRCTFEVATAFIRGVAVGDSVAVSGVCLTMVARRTRFVSADVSAETLRATTAGDWRVGTLVNLEKSLTLSDPLGGHLVSGHVDGIATLRARRREGRSADLEFGLPRGLAHYVARKGSVCLDGVSLTVNRVGKSGFGVNIVPHTLRHTTLGRLQPGDAVNLEVDLLARYLERLTAGRP